MLITKTTNQSWKTAGLALAVLASSSFSQLSMAVDEVNVAPGLTAVGSPLGLHGSDPTLLFDGKNHKGSATFTASHKNTAYYFSDAQGMKKFNLNPTHYIPQNGGFCTFGVSVGKKFDGNPKYASIVDDKLYVFLNKDIYNLFLKDKAGTIKKAKSNWTKIEHSSAISL